ncbi:MAG: DUF4352 domain-containing protein [Clostridia bacterium]|nr:DUF4352 domain-containing protein [Clostridia bacterium]
MLCPNCKKEIAENTQICPGCGAQVNPAPANTPTEKQKKPITKKWWFWVLIVVAILVVIGIFGSGSENNTDTSADNENVVQTDETTTAVAETTTVKTTFAVGESVADGNLKITYVSAEEWNDYSSYLSPKDGNKIIRLKFDFVNEGDVDAYLNSFYCYADNQSAERYYGGDDEISVFTLSAGRTTSGYIYFEVPENAENIEVEYEVNMWTDKKAIFDVVL